MRSLLSRGWDQVAGPDEAGAAIGSVVGLSGHGVDFLHSIGSFFWTLFWIVVLIGYLMALFSIITDLFRDRDTSGVVKAIWIVALIFLPLLTSLVYLIVKGRSMADRSARTADAMKQQQDAYIRDVAAKASPADQIAQAQKMLDAGAISQPEYERLKEKALA